MRQLRHFLIPLVTFSLCFIFSLLALAQEKLSEIIKKIEPSTIVILTYGNGGKILGQGSGFFISKDGDIITNKHVLVGAARASIKTSDGQVYPIAGVIAEDKEGDIIRASVTIPAIFVRPLAVSGSIPEVGEHIVVIGTPFGLERTVSDGIVSAVRQIPGFGKVYQVTAPISPGSSGSPVVNMKGEVIGIATFQFVQGQNLNFAIPAERISKLKKEKGKTLNEWKTGQLQEWSDSTDEVYKAGLSSLGAGDYEKALFYFENVVKKNPRDALAYGYIAACNSGLGRYIEAIEAYKQAIRLRPDLPWAYYNLGVVCGNMRRYMEAIDAYKQAIRIKPDLAEAHYSLGMVYGDLRHYMEAIDAYKQAIRIKPDYAEAHLNLGLTYLIIQDRGSALDQYNILKNLDNSLASRLFNMIYK